MRLQTLSPEVQKMLQRKTGSGAHLVVGYEPASAASSLRCTLQAAKRLFHGLISSSRMLCRLPETSC